MPRGRSDVLRKQARKMVYNVMQFMKKENEEGVKIHMRQVQKRVAAATGISRRTVQRIAATAHDSGLDAVCRTPAKKKRGQKVVTGIDSSDQGVIKRCVHNYHLTENELPSLRQLQRKLKTEMNFQGSISSVRRVLKNMGFRFKKSGSEKKGVMIEHSSIRLQRIEFLKNISKYRAEGRPIIYTDECFVDSSETTSKLCSDNGSLKELKKRNKKSEEVVIVHAASESGFVPNALLMFKAGINSTMNYDIYEKWILNQLLPNLPSNSVVVMDNVSYHNKLQDPAPTSTSKKSDMEYWLRERGIPFCDTMLKPQLYKLISLNKDRHKTYYIDRILKENTHSVLRLPLFHPDLNPLEMAWSAVKRHVAQKNISWNFNTVMGLIQEKVYEIEVNEWRGMCQHVFNIEEEYRKSDIVIDRLTEDVTINESGSESESDSDDSESSGDEESESSEEEAAAANDARSDAVYLLDS